jgi:putative SOS response-associated peptidase YedK
MCGRIAQTLAAVRAAADILGAPQPRARSEMHTEEHNAVDTSISEPQVADTNSSDWKGDNFNLCPGMGAIVIYKNKDNSIVSESKVWGLITKHGSPKNPVPTGMAQHFSALMYNARSDTLFIKQTFGNLLTKQRSCIVAVDGWFEWKQEVKGKKQPFFVRAKNEPYILFPGLWTQVATGRSDEPYLNTFTILTTEVAPCLTWLHTRMPVCCFDLQLAHEWLNKPTQRLHEKLLEDNYSSPPDQSCRWQWHAVTDEMTSLKFRSDKAIAPWKRPTIQNFFSAKSSGTDSSQKELPRKQSDGKEAEHGKKLTSQLSIPSSVSSNKITAAFSSEKGSILAPFSASHWSYENNQRKNEANTDASKGGRALSSKRPASSITIASSSSFSSPASKKSKTTTLPPKGSIAAFFSPKKKSASSPSK